MNKNNPGMPLPARTPQPTNPRAAAYGRDAQARASGQPAAPTKYTNLRAGGPTPPIPPLDGPSIEGRTMSEQAVMQRGGGQPPPGSILQGGTQPPSQGLDIRPQDLLPPEAQSDPEFIQGTGSMYAVAQPHLAAKYGVSRSGQRIPPQALRPQPRQGAGGPRAQLRPETLAGLEELNRGMAPIREAAQRGESGEMAAEAASAKSSAGGASTLGTAKGSSAGTAEKALSDAEIREKIGSMDEFDLQSLHEMYVKDIINNKEQKEIVESRLEPLNLADLVVNYSVTQRVPIIPNVFEPEFESLRAEDDLNIKRMVVEEAKTLQIGDRYLMDKFSLLGLACAVRSINGKPLPSHRDESGKFSEEKLKVKFEHILRMPLPMIATLGPHYFWFDQRVRKLFVAEAIKNG